MKIKQKNRSHGKIDNFPLPLKNEVEKRLLEGHTYESIADYIQSEGEPISPTSVHRYGKKYLVKFEAVKTARDFARYLAEDNIDRAATELHEANNSVVSEIILQHMFDEDIDDKEKIAIAKEIASLQQAQIRNEKLKIEVRKAAGEIRTAMNELKMQIFQELGEEHPDIADRIMEIADDIARRNENPAGSN